MNEIPINQSDVETLVTDLPEPVRRFLAKDLARASKTLTEKHHLHLDQGAVLQRDLMLVLLGVREPEELVNNLIREARLEKVSAESLLSDINQLVFEPINQQMRDANAQQASGPVPPIPAPAQTQLSSTPAPPIPKPEATRSPARAGLITDHEEPHIEVREAPKAPPPLIVIKPPAPPPPIQSAAPPMPLAPTPPPATQGAPQGTAKPIVKEYSVDPYREQPEDHEK